MATLFRSDTGQPIAEIDEAQLNQLIEALVEETAEDTDYYIDTDTLTYLEDQGVDPSLLTVLTAAIGDGGADIRWQR